VHRELIVTEMTSLFGELTSTETSVSCTAALCIFYYILFLLSFTLLLSTAEALRHVKLSSFARCVAD